MYLTCSFFSITQPYFYLFLIQNYFLFLFNSLKNCEPEFLISTPERLLELISLKAIDISGVSLLVMFSSVYLFCNTEWKIQSSTSSYSFPVSTLISMKCLKYKVMIKNMLVFSHIYYLFCLELKHLSQFIELPNF